MTDPPGRRLAHPERFGQTDLGQALVRLQQQPHRLQPRSQWKLGGVKRRVGRYGELEPAIAAGALVKTRSRAALAHVAAGDGDRRIVAAGRAYPAIRPDHAFQQIPAMCLIPEGRRHVVNGANSGKRCQQRFRHDYLL